MIRRRFSGGLRALVVGVIISGAALLAQQKEERFVPVEQEPQHHLVFKNAVLAVLDVQFPPAYVSLFHTHSNDNVSVRIATALTRTDTPEETGTPQTAAVGRVVFNSAHPPYSHRIANLGTTTIRIVDVEVLAQAPTSVAAAADDLAGHEVAVENDRVRIARLTVAPGAAVAAHTHPRGWLEVVVHGPEPGTFRWHEPGDIASPIAGGSVGAEYVEITVK